MFSIQYGEERNEPILENVSVLTIRLVWKFQKMKPEMESSFSHENIKPDVLVSLKSFLKIFRNAYVGFRN